MSATSFALFETALGICGLAWSGQGIAAVALPEDDPARLRARFARKWPEAVESPPPPGLDAVVLGIKALLAGEAADLSAAPLDLDGIGDFERRVYEIALTIPPGRTLTYGEIAARLGDKALSRAVGQALGRNPFPIVVPCHRVLAAGGRTGGFSGPGGVSTKFRLLEIDRAHGREEGLFSASGGLALQPSPRRRPPSALMRT
jgi:methylated-DNA-[protein]-cysteine S-methyltransferase